MDFKISRLTKKELLEALKGRYGSSTKKEKSRILDEFTAVSGCHRKHATRILRTGRQPSLGGTDQDRVRVGRRIYDEAVKEALVVVWEAADRICGKRLKSVLPQFVESLNRHGHLLLDREVKRRLLTASAATIDRLLAPVRRESRSKKRKKAKKISRQIPVRTFGDWNEPPPGYLEVDFVAHCGGQMAGSFIHTLVATDVCTGWTECLPLLAREQSLAIEGLEALFRRIPFPVKGIDCDNDSAFINEELFAFCRRRGIEQTRCRPYRKNDQAWVEQKNGSVVRRLVGHERFSGVAAGQALAHVYEAGRLYVNYFQPSFKLLGKARIGARVSRSYSPPATPCERLLGDGDVPASVKARLRSQRERLDPLQLLHRIREGQAALAKLSSDRDTAEGPGKKTLEKFLSELPTLWRSGEVRPTHRKTPAKTRHWRTRKDPFESVWLDVLQWLQSDPDKTAKELFERLRAEHAGRFKDGQLRTLQRRVREWRHLMARQLVHACINARGEKDEPIEVGVIGERLRGAK